MYLDYFNLTKPYKIALKTHSAALLQHSAGELNLGLRK